MHLILKHVEGGEPLEIAVVDTREQAEKLLERRKKLFPGDEYETREVQRET